MTLNVERLKSTKMFQAFDPDLNIFSTLEHWFQASSSFSLSSSRCFTVHLSIQSSSNYVGHLFKVGLDTISRMSTTLFDICLSSIDTKEAGLELKKEWKTGSIVKGPPLGVKSINSKFHLFEISPFKEKLICGIISIVFRLQIDQLFSVFQSLGLLVLFQFHVLTFLTLGKQSTSSWTSTSHQTRWFWHHSLNRNRRGVKEGIQTKWIFISQAFNHGL